MNDESKFMGMSVRAILAVIIIIACCGLALIMKDMGVLKDLALVAVSFYFGQKSIPTNPGGTNVSSNNSTVVVDPNAVGGTKSSS